MPSKTEFSSCLLIANVEAMWCSHVCCGPYSFRYHSHPNCDFLLSVGFAWKAGEDHPAHICPRRPQSMALRGWTVTIPVVSLKGRDTHNSIFGFMSWIFSRNQPPGAHRGSWTARLSLAAFLLSCFSFLPQTLTAFVACLKQAICTWMFILGTISGMP